MATHVLDNRTPFEALYGTPPDLSGAHLWGCKVWVHDDSRFKLDVLHSWVIFLFPYLLFLYFYFIFLMPALL